MARPRPKIYLATDHAGFRLKETIADYLGKKGYTIKDFGAFTDQNEQDDYPDFIIPLAEAVAKSRGRAVGLIFGGNGLGELVAANKVKGIRAVTAYDRQSAVTSRTDDNANILSLGGRTMTAEPKLAKRLVSLWLETPFSDAPRHRRRLRKISDYESRNQCLC